MSWVTRKKIKYPPLNLVKRFIGISRKPYSPTMLFYFENGDTYTMTFENADVYLKLVGVPEDRRSSILDYIQNFNNVIVDIRLYQMVQMPEEQLKNVMTKFAEYCNSMSWSEFMTFLELPIEEHADNTVTRLGA